jgi:hypothetical protein
MIRTKTAEQKYTKAADVVGLFSQGTRDFPVLRSSKGVFSFDGWRFPTWAHPVSRKAGRPVGIIPAFERL